jgi:hypothetical protein
VSRQAGTEAGRPGQLVSIVGVALAGHLFLHAVKIVVHFLQTGEDVHRGQGVDNIEDLADLRLEMKLISNDAEDNHDFEPITIAGTAGSKRAEALYFNASAMEKIFGVIDSNISYD